MPAKSPSSLWFFVDDFDASYFKKNIGVFIDFFRQYGIAPAIITNKIKHNNQMTVPVHVIPSIKLRSLVFYLPSRKYWSLIRNNHNFYWGYAERGHLLLIFFSKLLRGGKIFIKTDSCITRIKKGGFLYALAELILMRCPLKHADLVITEIPAAQKKISHFRKNNNIFVIPNGFSGETSGNTHQIKEKTIIYAGRITPVKGVDLAINAFKKNMPENGAWKLKIFGFPEDHDYFKSICRLAEDFPNISINTELNKKELLDELARAAIYILPSREEGLSNTIPDALANGCLVVATDAGDTKFYADPNNDLYLVKNSDIDGLSQSLREAIANYSEEGSNSNRDFAHKYLDWNTNLHELGAYLAKQQ